MRKTVFFAVNWVPGKPPLLSADPLDPLTEQGEVLSQLHHGHDGHPADHHAGGPEQGVEQHVGAVQFGQDHVLLDPLGVVETGEALVLPEVLHHHVHQRHGLLVVLPALGDVRALGRNQREEKVSPNLLLFRWQVGISRDDYAFHNKSGILLR